jgi:hypothetical protein
VELKSVVGPIGYTFDSDSTAPLFGNTSFIVPPPESATMVTDLGWFFVKLRFRRKLEPTGLERPRRSGQQVDKGSVGPIPSAVLSIRVRRRNGVRRR